MSALSELQSEFRAALLDPGRSVPLGVVSYASLRPERRFGVYRNNVVMGLIEALKATFPVVLRLVGQEFFHATAREFIFANPPRSPILSRYGSEFPDFLRGFAPVADIPYVGDVAELEWLQIRAYHAPDRAPLTPDQLSQVDPDRAGELVFELHPSIGLLASPHPVYSIWRTNAHDEAVARIDAESGGECAVVLRPHLETHVIRTSVAAFALLRAMRTGKCLAEAAKIALARDPGFDLQTHFALFIDHGAFVDASLASTPAI